MWRVSIYTTFNLCLLSSVRCSASGQSDQLWVVYWSTDEVFHSFAIEMLTKSTKQCDWLWCSGWQLACVLCSDYDTAHCHSLRLITCQFFIWDRWISRLVLSTVIRHRWQHKMFVENFHGFARIRFDIIVPRCVDIMKFDIRQLRWSTFACRSHIRLMSFERITDFLYHGLFLPFVVCIFLEFCDSVQ